MALARKGLLIKIMFWWTSCFLKIVPCVCMTILSLSLTRQLQESVRRRRKLSHTSTKRQSGMFSGLTIKSNASGVSSGSTGSQADQKTRMLLAILLCYLVSVMPFGITVPLVGLLGRTFKINFFDPMFIVFDLLALSNSLVVFVLLISMSRLFRETLYKIFWPTISLFSRSSSRVASTVESSRISSHPAQSTTSNMTAVVVFENKETQTSQSSLGQLVAEFERVLYA